MRKRCLFILLVFLFSGQTYAFQDDSIICVGAPNEDGDITSDQVGYCIEAEDGDLCPVDALDCTFGSGVEIGCPEGAVLDTGSNKCVSNPGISCTSGFDYIEEHNLCATNAVCSDGSVLNPITDKCEINPVFSCPSGTVLYNWNGTNICKKSPICASGSTYNCSTKRCERAVSYTCPSGTTLRNVGGSYRCYRDATVNPQCATLLLDFTCSAWGYQQSGITICPGTPPIPPAGTTVIGHGCGNEFQGKIWTMIVYGNTTCPSGYTINGTECYIAATATCPSGYTRSGSVCYRAATCDSGYTYNANIPSSQCTGGGACYVNSTACSSGFAYVSGKCVKDPACSLGSYNLEINQCAIPTSVDCPSGTTYNDIAKLCESYPSCPPGSIYDAERNICVRTPQCASGDTYNCTSAACERAVSYTCPSGTTLRNVGGSYRCYRDALAYLCREKHEYPIAECSNYSTWGINSGVGIVDMSSCPGNLVGQSVAIVGGVKCSVLNHYLRHYTCSFFSGYTLDGDECYTTATPTCPSGYTRSGTVCRKTPDCSIVGPEWEFDAAITHDGCKGVCFAEGVVSVCPHGDQFACMYNPITGTKQCSPNECFVFIEGTEDDDTEEGITDKTDIGFEEDGSCVGDIYLFNGYDYRCREAGYKTTWHNCCSTSSNLNDICNDREQTLANMRSNNQCHQVGSYCSKKAKLGGGCLQRVKTFCCYNSEFGYIVQTQGRDLMKSPLPWGSPKAPNCVGFKPSEFEMLDFDSIDFSGMFDDVVYPDTNNLRQEGESKINEFYQQYSN